MVRKAMTSQTKRQYIRKRSQQQKKEEGELPAENTYATEKVAGTVKSVAYGSGKIVSRTLVYGKEKLSWDLRQSQQEVHQKQTFSPDEKMSVSFPQELSTEYKTSLPQQRVLTKKQLQELDGKKIQLANQGSKAVSQSEQAREQQKNYLKRKMQQRFRMQVAHPQEEKSKSLVKMLLSFEKILAAKAKQMTSTLFISGGIMVLVIMVLLFGMVSALVASPFGVLFANEDTTTGTLAISQVVAALNTDFAEQVEEIIEGNPHDSMTLNGDMADWTDVIAIFAVRTAGRDDNIAMDVVTIDRDRQEKIKEVFNDMNVLSYDVEVIRHGRGESSWTERILHITIEARTADLMVNEYGFTEGQKEILAELLEERALLQSLVGSLTVSTVESRAILRNLPADLPAERRAVIETAMQLVGKVNYFWGGKSSAIGWDNRWGLPTRVTAEGSSTTGKIRAYGLDCSGYVDWVFHNSLDYIVGQGGGAASQHRNCVPVSWENAEIGDLVFYADDSHVGIVAGWDSEGEILIVHCAAGYNNVVITGKEGFTSVGRPKIYE